MSRNSRKEREREVRLHPVLKPNLSQRLGGFWTILVTDLTKLMQYRMFLLVGLGAEAKEPGKPHPRRRAKQLDLFLLGL